MPVPIIAAGAAAVAARLAAKKLAQEAAKKAAKAAAANARGLKAANAKVSKNNAGQTGSKLKSDILKNAKPARANRERGGSLSTLRSQGKTKSTPTQSQKNSMRHDIRIKQEKISEKQLKEHYRSMFKQWND
jgi:hypothetical protein